MPSLWDQLGGGDLSSMFQPVGQGGQPIGITEALRQQQGGLVGLGLGLMSQGDQWQNAMRGYQAGSQTDALNAYRRAQAKQQQDQLAFQKSEAGRQASQWQQQFERGGETDYQRMQRDINRVAGTPEEQQIRDYYRSKLDVGPPPSREAFDPNIGRNVLQEWNPRTRKYETAMAPGVPAAAAPADPFTAGGQPVYGQGGNYGAPAAPAAPAAAPSTPMMPAQKPPSAHEQSAIDDAEKAVTANQQVIGNLKYAKTLSPKAASGPYALERGQLGANLPGFLGEGGKETVLLHNTIIGNAVEQLKATFGGNPSEGERKILLELQGSVNSPDSVRQEIYDRAIQAAQDRLETNQRKAAGIRGGTYYRPGGGPAAQPPAAAGGRPGGSDPFGIR